MKKEIDRIVELLPHIADVEMLDKQEVRKVGFRDIEDFTFIQDIQDSFNNFMQYIEDWDGLEERIPTIKRTFILVQLLKKENINV